ncbi:lipopolysaccharide kinase InaA family protein [Gramella sp. AN32]|uniref:Lipopolysaccharide kinase InaA family protein n=1 Tax=Christiangramia antarctica TaxID=2058158 RepID=A0ABW5X7G7_9FLAO|nr:lipopolysaccharide kinase InaA family protein [Gramella sp. AN32]MCM4154559.1 Kdo domain containing protein [Gramella sp. AN32]
MKSVVSKKYDPEKVLALIENFKNSGEVLSSGRNEIRLFDLDGKILNVKSFKVPNFINKITYKYFRKSKAQRSYGYANVLKDKKIGTPEPIAFFENSEGNTFQESYYVCEHLDADLTFRELVSNPNFPDHEEILRAFTRFTFKLHEENIEFLDHSPGNTLIKKNGGHYDFYLVDLNRMNFKEMTFLERMNNFSRLTPKKEMVVIMANEYAKFVNKPEEEVFGKMWFLTQQFQERFHREKRWKKKLKFWKN